MPESPTVCIMLTLQEAWQLRDLLRVANQRLEEELLLGVCPFVSFHVMQQIDPLEYDYPAEWAEHSVAERRRIAEVRQEASDTVERAIDELLEGGDDDDDS